MSLESSVTITFWDNISITIKIDALLQSGWRFPYEHFEYEFIYKDIDIEDLEFHDVTTTWPELRAELENLVNSDKRYYLNIHWMDTYLGGNLIFSSDKEIKLWIYSERPKLKDGGNFTDFSILLSRIIPPLLSAGCKVLKIVCEDSF